MLVHRNVCGIQIGSYNSFHKQSYVTNDRALENDIAIELKSCETNVMHTL